MMENKFIECDLLRDATVYSGSEFCVEHLMALLREAAF